MNEFTARISRVRMKNGGADVRVIDRQPINEDGEDWRGSIVSNARNIAKLATDDAPLVGYLVVGFYADGGSSSGFRIDSDLCPLPSVLFPAWAAEIVRRDIVTAGEAEHRFETMFEWQE